MAAKDRPSVFWLLLALAVWLLERLARRSEPPAPREVSRGLVRRRWLSFVVLLSMGLACACGALLVLPSRPTVLPTAGDTWQVGTSESLQNALIRIEPIDGASDNWFVSVFITSLKPVRAPERPLDLLVPNLSTVDCRGAAGELADYCLPSTKNMIWEMEPGEPGFYVESQWEPLVADADSRGPSSAAWNFIARGSLEQLGIRTNGLVTVVTLPSIGLSWDNGESGIVPDEHGRLEVDIPVPDADRLNWDEPLPTTMSADGASWDQQADWIIPAQVIARGADPEVSDRDQRSIFVAGVLVGLAGGLLVAAVERLV